jgi:hypothetical protein
MVGGQEAGSNSSTDRVRGTPFWCEPVAKVFEQNFLHIRHMEIERLLFTAAWGTLVGASLAFLQRQGETASFAGNIVILFLFGITLFGFLLTVRLGAAISDVIVRQQLIAEKSDLLEIAGGISLEKHFSTCFRVRYLIPGIYLLTLVGLVLLFSGIVKA